jgi:hypothetical protein
MQKETLHVDGLVPHREGPIPADPDAYDDTDPIGLPTVDGDRAPTGEDEPTLDLEYNKPVVPATDEETASPLWPQRVAVPLGSCESLGKRAWLLRYVSDMRWREVALYMGLHPTLVINLAAMHG